MQFTVSVTSPVVAVVTIRNSDRDAIVVVTVMGIEIGLRVV